MFDGNWHHIILTSSSDFYVDGVLQTATSIYDRAFNGSLTMIGAYDLNTTFFLDALMDNVRIFNRVLNPTEVNQLKNTDLGV